MSLRIRQIVSLSLALLLMAGSAPGFCGGVFAFAPAPKKAKRACGACCQSAATCCCCRHAPPDSTPEPAPQKAPRNQSPGCPPTSPCCCTAPAPFFFAHASLPFAHDLANIGETIPDLRCEVRFVPADGPFHPPR
ncbi:MAG: hypothetical protein U0793_14290 [Gemmataceae bacterium]